MAWLPLVSAFVLTFAAQPLFAQPVTASPQLQHIPLLGRRSIRPAGSIEVWASHQMSNAVTRYGSIHKNLVERAAQSFALANGEADSYYAVQVQVGTPPSPFSLILDTGSSDLWIATSPCKGCAPETPKYDPKLSTSSSASKTRFSITYGSGSAKGTMAKDTISIGEFSQSNQMFAAVTESEGVLTDSISGILGAGWKALANSGATPSLQAMSSGGAWTENVFSLAITRFGNVTEAQDKVEDGGVLTLGGVDQTLFQGAINWIPLAPNPGFWKIALDDIIIGGKSLNVKDAAVAIDSGTTLCGVPSAVATKLYAEIKGAKSITMNGAPGYFSFPCFQNIQISLTFGGIDYPIDSADFNVGYLDTRGSQCLGAVFALDTDEDSPSFIIGATFLKNVYSVFRFSPNPAIGFATLTNKINSRQSPLVAEGSVVAVAAADTKGNVSPVPVAASLPAASVRGFIPQTSSVPATMSFGQRTTPIATLTAALIGLAGIHLIL